MKLYNSSNILELINQGMLPQLKEKDIDAKVITGFQAIEHDQKTRDVVYEYTYKDTKDVEHKILHSISKGFIEKLN